MPVAGCCVVSTLIAENMVCSLFNSYDGSTACEIWGSQGSD